MPFFKKKLFVLFFITFTKLFYGQQKYSTGLIFDNESYKKIEKISSALKFNNNIKEVYSLKQFCPTPGNQGNLGTCTSWATGYAALTISFSIDNNINDIKEIDNNSFSPLYIYNQIKVNNSCEGAHLLKALNLAQRKGDCKFTDFNPIDCNYLPGYFEDNIAQLYKIKDYCALFDENSANDTNISNVINSLASNKPVVIGLSLRKSFQEVSKNGVYSPNEYYFTNNKKAKSGHALCIVGYDNIKSQFEVINSWGINWGNNGFFYLKYDDFLKDCNEAYSFTLGQKSNRNIKLKGNFQILKYIETEKSSNKNNFEIISPFLGSDKCYYIENNIKKNDFFRIKATNLVKNTYVYIISYKPDTTAEVLFPVNYKKNNQDSPLILSNNSFIDLPENLENAYSTDQKGYDILCILYSNKRIDDLDKKILTIKTFNGNIWEWLKDSFKNEIVNESYYKYNTFDMGINSDEKFIGNIIPLILKVKVE